MMAKHPTLYLALLALPLGTAWTQQRAARPTKPTTPPTTTSGSCSVIGIGQNASLNGFVPFLTTDPWRTSVASAAVDSNSTALIAQLGSSVLHPDFGSGMYNGATIGIPYIDMTGQAGVKINYVAYGAESDPGPMPIPASTWVEGYPSTAAGDRHLLALNRDNCFLYELYDAYLQGDGSWNADAGAVWDLLNNNDRPYTWTSTDAAGLPVFPGLARYDEVAAGVINHALRFTVANTRGAFVAPATHWASSSTASNRLPMGARLRLKASYDISGFSTQSKVILTALKNYGMILADNGSNLYVTGAPSDSWNNDDLSTLGKVPASAFEVVSMGTVYTSSNVPTGTAPVITSFTASSSSAVAAGTTMTLNWASTGASYYVISPQIGAVRGTSVAVTPTATTTYTLYATNHFGRTTKTMTVQVK